MQNEKKTQRITKLSRHTSYIRFCL